MYVRRRVKLRRQYVQKQHEFAFAMQRDTEPHMIERSPDDALRYQSVMFALIRALDKVRPCAATLFHMPAHAQACGSSAALSDHIRHAMLRPTLSDDTYL